MSPRHAKQLIFPGRFPTLVNAEALGDILGVTGRTVLNWAASGKIPTALRIGRTIRFAPDDVAAALGLTPTNNTPPKK